MTSSIALTIHPYTPHNAANWDAFVAQAPMATFLHSRAFLSYHGTRFEDRSVFLTSPEGNWLGVFPAAVFPQDAQTVGSHPGATYGGLVHHGALSGQLGIDALAALKAYYHQQGMTSLVIKPVPHIYHQRPSQDDLYALFRHQAVRTRADLSCAVDVGCPGPIGSRRKRGEKQAQRAGVTVVEDPAYIAAFWQVLTERLAAKHESAPVHTLDEIQLLMARFPQQIRCIVALCAGQVVAGTVLFVSPAVVHAQYIAASNTGYEAHALDAVFPYCLDLTRSLGYRYFDFGTSNEDQGQVLNAGLYQFKQEFGASGVIYEQYKLALG